MKKISMFTDGAARGNPNGPGGYGTIILYEDGKETELFGGYKKTTNNRMELMAVISGFQEIKDKSYEVDLYSDSKYVIDAFLKKWIDNWKKNDWVKSDGKAVKNPDLWKYLLKLMEKHTVHFHWIKGHAGHPMNERCDKLATDAADNHAELDDVILKADDDVDNTMNYNTKRLYNMFINMNLPENSKVEISYRGPSTNYVNQIFNTTLKDLITISLPVDETKLDIYKLAIVKIDNEKSTEEEFAIRIGANLNN